MGYFGMAWVPTPEGMRWSWGYNPGKKKKKEKIVCPECEGEGLVCYSEATSVHDKESCPKCGGWGEINDISRNT